MKVTIDMDDLAFSVYQNLEVCFPEYDSLGYEEQLAIDNVIHATVERIKEMSDAKAVTDITLQYTRGTLSTVNDYLKMKGKGYFD